MSPRGSTVAASAEMILQCWRGGHQVARFSAMMIQCSDPQSRKDTAIHLVEKMVDTVLGVVYRPVWIVETAGQVADVETHRLPPCRQLCEAIAVADTVGVGVRVAVASLVYRA
jgi:hypothetical protein|eukprot:SAG25_NODE_122_length_14632_cov_129.472098_15_plen_113_part_00